MSSLVIFHCWLQAAHVLGEHLTVAITKIGSQ